MINILSDKTLTLHWTKDQKNQIKQAIIDIMNIL